MPATDRIMEIKKDVMRRVTALGDEVEQDGWREHWLDLSRFLLNRRGRYLKSKSYEPRKGGKANDEVNNGTPEQAVHTASAGMMGGFTSPSVPWFHLVPEDKDLRNFKPVKEYLWRQQERMYSLWARSNWYRVLPTMYEELNVFGTAAMRMDVHPVRGIHCTQHTIGSFYLASGADGYVDTICYRYPRTVRQLMSLYKESDLSQTTRDRIAKKDFDAYVKCINFVEVNSGRDRNYKDWRGMPYRAITLEEETADDEGVLKIGGHDLFPVMTPRTSRRADDVYGSSAGMRALPDARQLQIHELRGGEGLLKTLRPPLNVPSAKYRATVAAGQNNVYKGQRSDAIRPTFLTQFPYSENEDKIAKIEDRLKNTLGATTFNHFETLDATGNHNMTVPEIMERRSEKLQLQGPTHHSVHEELLHPAIEAHWYYMGRNGQLEPPPEELANMQLEVLFTGQMDLASRSAIVNGTELLLERIAGLNQYYPGTTDNVDADKAVQHIASGYLAPPDVMRDPDTVDEMRRARAEEAQKQRQLEEQNLQADTAQKLGNAPLGQGSALDETPLGATV
jgi:hypothetical protein